MSVFPLIVTAVCLVFGLSVLSMWRQRRRPQLLLWGISLLMACIAAAAYVGFLADGSPLLFRLYYIFGALLNAAYLGMGSLYLILSRRNGDMVLSALAILSAIGVALMIVAPINDAALHSAQVHAAAGTGVLKPGLWLVLFILHNVFGAVTVAGVAIYSAIKAWRKQAPRRFATSNIAIALGVLIVSQAGSSARLGLPGVFWATQAVGFAVIFAGFLLTTSLATFGAPRGPGLPTERDARPA